MRTLRSALAASLALSTLGTSATIAAAANYGCFVVTAPSLNIRDKPYSSAAVIGAAKKGDILEKRKLWCTPRGFWCAIRHGSLEGYADKNFMDKVTCPKS